MTAWKVRIGKTEFTAPDIGTLKEWVSQRRVLPEHYVFHPPAREVDVRT